MLEINRKNSRLWSRMGARAFYGSALSAIAAENQNVIALSADLGRSSGLARFAAEYPEQFINTGIAEQSMVGTSAGLSRMGYDVFASTFAPFASLRAGEIVRMNMGYMQEPVKLVALGSGLAMGFLGNSHYGLEDVAIMRAIPGITIVSPADCAEIYKTLLECLNYKHPVYIRLTGAINLPIVYEADYEFEIGKGVWIRPPKETSIISSGTTVGHSLRAINELEQQGCEIGLLNMHTIKPLDHKSIDECVKISANICIIEEHTRVGGLGSAVLEYVNEQHPNYSGKILLHSLKDEYLTTGDYPFLLEQSKLDANGIKQFLQTGLQIG